MMEHPRPLSLSKQQSDSISQTVLCKRGFDTLRVPTDGHCILHSISTALEHEWNVKISPKELLLKLESELQDIYESYEHFLTAGVSCNAALDRRVAYDKFRYKLQAYTKSYSYNSEIGDLVLPALCKALDITVNVVQCSDGQDLKIDTIPLQFQAGKGQQQALHGCIIHVLQSELSGHKHYDALIRRDKANFKKKDIPASVATFADEFGKDDGTANYVEPFEWTKYKFNEGLELTGTWESVRNAKTILMSKNQITYCQSCRAKNQVSEPREQLDQAPRPDSRTSPQSNASHQGQQQRVPADMTGSIESSVDDPNYRQGQARNACNQENKVLTGDATKAKGGKERKLKIGENSDQNKNTLTVDEEIMTFILFRRSGEYEDFCKNHCCTVTQSYRYLHDKKELTLNITAKSADLREKACDEFARFYQSLCEDVGAWPVFIPDTSFARLKEKLKEEDALLWGSTVYHLVCPKAKMDKAMEKIQQIVAKYQSEPDQSRNTNNIIIRDESQLPSGLKVFIAEGDLVKQRVDAIVNPANSGLHHGSGAARAIAKAAGSELKQECEKYQKQNGDLRIGEAMHTSAGQLVPRIKYVIHVVGPDARKMKDIEVCRTHVQEAFFNCLIHANIIGDVQSVAIPAISSGIYEVPVDVVANAAYSALIQFEKICEPTQHLKEVYFINNDQPTVAKFLDTFKRLRSGKERAGLGNNGGIVRLDQVYDRKNGSLHTDDSLQHRLDQENPQPTVGIQRTNVPMGIDPADRYPDYRNMQEDESMGASQGPEDTAKDVSSKTSSVDPVETQSEAKAMPDEKAAPKEETCVICMDTITDPHTLKCKHTFCKGCIDECFKQFQPKCPSCGQLFGVLKGNQPDGHMSFNNQSYSLSGYNGYGTIEIKYSFHDGIQGDNHPNPGQRYRGTHRAAYLPDNPEGREVFGLLKLAFDARLLFTIGRSLTTGQDNVVVWNDIHQKTSPTGQYGYPDPAYLQRVKAELAAKGIVPKK